VQQPQNQVLWNLWQQAGVVNAEPDAPAPLPDTATNGAFQPAAQVWNWTTIRSLLQSMADSISGNAHHNWWDTGPSGGSQPPLHGWPGYTHQPAGGVINLGQARSFATGAGVVVALVDTGVDATHPTLAGSVLPGWDFTSGTPGGAPLSQSTVTADQSTTAILDDDGSVVVDQSTTAILDGDGSVVVDQSTTAILDQTTTAILDTHPVGTYAGHGTMVAGLVHFVAPGASILPIKVFGNDGTASLSDILKGLYYAVDHGADVINMSFTLGSSSQELTQAINFAYSRGVVMVAAAGNDGANEMVYPAGYDQVIGVGSTDNFYKRSGFSDFGRVASLAAPGEGLVTTYPGRRYAAGWGTSFSAPLVSGAAALLSQMNSGLNGKSAEKVLQQATPIGQDLGAGELDLFRACSFLASLFGGN
jgi:subtilisin family serine protease